MSTQSHADIASEFITMAASGKVREAYALHVAPTFIHHNAYFPGGRASPLAAMWDVGQAIPPDSPNALGMF